MESVGKLVTTRLWNDPRRSVVGRVVKRRFFGSARYDSVVRIASLWILTVLVASCGGATPRLELAPRSHIDALPIAENQQGATVARAPDVTPPPDGPVAAPIAGVYLWCAVPSGRACTAASAALGTGPKATSGLPPALLDVEDLTDDCLEPTITSVSRRLAPALAVSDAGWRDQAGSYLDLSMLGDMYSAAGCINDADQALPIAKISAGSASSPRVYLVRIWDSGEASP